MIGSTVSGYEFQVINFIAIIKWRLYLWIQYHVWLALMRCRIYVQCFRTYWIHSQQICVSGYKRYWNIKMTAILMNTLPDTVCIDLLSTWRGNAPQNGCMTGILMNTLPSMISIDVMSTLCGIATQNVCRLHYSQGFGGSRKDPLTKLPIQLNIS